MFNTILEELMDYSKKIIQGKILACRRHKQSCKRFLNDLHRMEHDVDFPYYWDEEEAQRIVKWYSFLKHSKGVLAGERLQLHVFQKFMVCNIEAWKHIETDYRRFRYVYIQIGRKNSKSQLQGGLASYEAGGRGVQSAECYTLGVERDQAKIVFNEIDLMMTKPLKRRFKVTQKEITHKKSKSFIKHLSKKAGKTGDGLNPQFASIDEYHAHETDDMYEIMTSGMGARPEPLIVIITTAGEDFENKPCYTEYQDCCSILEETSYNEEYFVMICELDEEDDPEDSKVWEKANPILCSYPEGRKSLKSLYKKAFESTDESKRVKFLTKNCNIWVKFGDKKFINAESWEKCERNYTLEKFRGADCYIGIDLSKTEDLTSCTFEFPFLEENERRYALHSHSFIPKGTLEEKKKTDKAKYDFWAKKGYLTVTTANEGVIVDFWAMIDYIEKIKVEYELNIIAIGYDPHGAALFVGEMEKKYECISITQSAKALNEATVNFRDLIKVQQIYHNNNKLLSWCAPNCQIDSNSFGEIKISKISRFKRIDPIAAGIFSHKLSMNYWNDDYTKEVTEEDIDDFYDRFG